MVIQNISAAAQIERESEPQRHHARVHLPVIIVLDDKKYTTDDISEGGFAIFAGKEVFEKGLQDAKVYFPFQNFAFHLKLKAQPVYHNDNSHRIGFSFHEIDARQLSLLNLVIRSSLTGELSSDGKIMDAIRHRHTPKPANYPHNKWSRWLPLGVILLAGLAGLALLAGSIYENTSIIKSYVAVIEADSHMVRAESSGIYNSLLADGARKVTRGQELAVLKLNTGTDDVQPPSTAAAMEDGVPTPPDESQSIIIRSPCDCVIFKKHVKENEFRAVGEPLFELLPMQTNSWVIASVKPDQSHRLRLLDDAYVQVAGDNKFLEGHVTEFLSPDFENNIIRVRVKTTDPIPPELIGQPAYVEFMIF